MARTNATPISPQQALTVSTVAVALTVPAPASNIPSPNYALIRCEIANVRWRDDGTAPTASVGYLLQVGEELPYDGNLSAIKFIRKDAADATLTISYYRVDY